MTSSNNRPFNIHGALGAAMNASKEVTPNTPPVQNLAESSSSTLPPAHNPPAEPETPLVGGPQQSITKMALSVPTVFPNYNIANNLPKDTPLTELHLRPLLLMHVTELNSNKALDTQQKQTMRLLEIVTGLSEKDVGYLSVQDLTWLLQHIFELLTPMREFLEKSQGQQGGV